MNRLFGTAKATVPKAPAPTLADASGKMDGRLGDIDTKIAKCDEDLKRFMSQGRGPQQRQQAMQVMKRKKMYEQQRNQLMNSQFNVDSLAFAQEQVEVTAMSVEAMKAGQQELKASYAKMNIGDIETMMDDLADLNDDAQEIQEIMGQAFAVPDGFDEADFEAEFAALEEETKMESLAGIGQGSAPPSYLTPSAPSGYEAASAPAAPLPAPSAAAAGEADAMAMLQR